MTTRADRLQAFLDRYNYRPVVWGVDDCSACPAKWVEEETGRRIPFPQYSSPAEVDALKERAGGLVSIWESHLAQAGIYERFSRPQLGDVGIIDTRLYGQIGCIILEGAVVALRKEVGGWHPMGPIRKFLKVWAVE